MAADNKIEKKAVKVEKAEYQIVAFGVDELPAYHDPEKPDETAIKLAIELFEVQMKEFNPADKGRYDGHGRYGHTFEVKIKWTIAQNLAVQRYPQIIDIFE